MTNFQQYLHKMADYQLRTLHGVDEDSLLQKLSELASEHGNVQSVEKIGEDCSRKKKYLICFDSPDEAVSAACGLAGRLYGEASIIITLR